MQTETKTNGSQKMVPLNPDRALDIPDGERLHYVNYVDGKKHADLYLVTKRETNNKGDLLYRVYFDIINVLDNKKLDKDFKKWAAFLVIDPRFGTIIESGGALQPNDMINWINIGGVQKWHYKMNDAKSNIDYFYNKSTPKGPISKNFKINTKPNVPTGDLWMSMFFVFRLLDIKDGSYMHLVNPFFFQNNTWPFELKFVQKETVETKAGKFDCTKFIATRGRMFPWSLFQNGFVPIPNLPYWVENSPRKLVIKESTMAGNSGDYVLEAIGNANDE